MYSSFTEKYDPSTAIYSDTKMMKSIRTCGRDMKLKSRTQSWGIAKRIKQTESELVDKAERTEYICSHWFFNGLLSSLPYHLKDKLRDVCRQASSSSIQSWIFKHNLGKTEIYFYSNILDLRTLFSHGGQL